MRRSYSTLAIVLIALYLAGPALAQPDVKKVEVGVQFTSFTLFPPPREGFQPANVTEPEFGGRITYNLTRRIAVESELNFFPNKNIFQFLGEGRAVQGQFGIKTGKRFKQFGVFGKARPGFLSVGKVFFHEPGAKLPTPYGFSIPNARIGRQTYFTTDVGAVLEFYPSDRTLVRFDAGDTIVRYGKSFEEIGFNPSQLAAMPAKIKHNFQFTAGVGFRFKDSRPSQSVPVSKVTSREKILKYEVGIQFTSISFDPPTPIFGDAVISGPELVDTEPGFGGRFTYNLNRSVALEAEGNFFPRHQSLSGGGGRLLQSQFGVKAGHRWQSFGIFGKARPGMLSFSQVNKLVSVQNGFFGTIPVQFGIFRTGLKSYFSADVGGVIEYYMSRRLMTRIDVGDTIVHYSEYAIRGFIASQQIIRRPPETHHNFQFSAGVGFRF
ncbi:MAG TPA: hypothetical protein VK582_06335 [Pyrinomonadaceae bacterium]|nr:hypothetical protein [Pyrinomonadaceae bacterium]